MCVRLSIRVHPIFYLLSLQKCELSSWIGIKDEEQHFPDTNKAGNGNSINNHHNNNNRNHNSGSRSSKSSPIFRRCVRWQNIGFLCHSQFGEDTQTDTRMQDGRTGGQTTSRAGKGNSLPNLRRSKKKHNKQEFIIHSRGRAGRIAAAAAASSPGFAEKCRIPETSALEFRFRVLLSLLLLPFSPRRTLQLHCGCTTNDGS